MKKVLLSLSTLIAVGAIVVGGTLAFYNDTETSTGNIFVAGSIDLKVDHLKQTYNGDDCQTCSLTIFSGDGGAQVVAGTNSVITEFPFVAPEVTPTSITDQYWATHDTAEWIWASPSTLVGDDGSNGDVSYTFEHKFTWWGDAVDVDLVMDVAADNQYQILLNGSPIASGLGSAEYTTLDSVAENDFLNEVLVGENTLTFVVTNLVNTPESNNNPLNNPGGLLYYLTVERDPEDCEQNSEFQNACRLWTEKDLDEGDTFFNFGDIKPADWGTNVISLHVSSNDAYACLITTDAVDDENELLETEEEAGDDTADMGELASFIDVFTWDDDGDGIFEDGETTLGEGTLADLDSIMSLDTDEDYLTATTTKNIGLAWCAGDLTVDEGGIVCDGAGMLNSAQSDSFSANLVAYAEQVRNNGEFSCEAVELDSSTEENEPEQSEIIFEQ